MLVTFSCKAHENVVMFGEVAKRLLNMMGHSGKVPGALVADEVPNAFAQLQQAIGKDSSNPQTSKLDEDKPDENDTDAISIVHRALPLIDLLQDAVKHHCNVMWE